MISCNVSLLACLALLAASCGPGPEPKETPVKEPAKKRIKAPSPKRLRHGLAPQAFVLTYHDVIPSRWRDALWFDTTTQELRDQLDWLERKGASFITLDELYGYLTEGKPLPENPVAITFADNYLGFYERALPILRERKIPAAMFVHTGYVGSITGRPKMSWEQLIELDKEGLVTIASQTVSHPEDLSQLSNDEIEREVRESKKTLESRLGHPVRYLAYPNGKFDARSEKAAEEAGYLMAFSEEQTPAEKSPTIYSVARYVHTKYRQAWYETH